jgi:hypothetical protein
MRVDMLAARRIGGEGDRKDRAEVRREDDKRRGWRRSADARVTKNALVRKCRGVGRDPVFELVNGQSQLREQQDRRHP